MRKTLKFMSNAVISSLRPNIKKVTSQNHGKKNVFSPKSKIKFSVLSGGLAQIAVHVHSGVGDIVVYDTNTICVLMHSYGRTD